MGAKTRKLSQINDSLIEWQSVVVADGSTGLTAVAGRGYFINTTAGAITVTLPSTTAKPGDTIQLKDYARTWGTNAVSIASNIFDGSTNTNSFSTNGQTVTLIYMDNTRGWSLINEDTTTSLGATFISATGGTITTSGDFKIHTFTGDGCFVVATVGNPAGSSTVDYLVVAGGGGGGAAGGGGGGGGYRESSGTTSGSYTVSPLGSGVPALPVSATTFPITVGGGGSPGPSTNLPGGRGSDSVFSTITSTGGGGGSGHSGLAPTAPWPGGSGGGGGGPSTTAGTGNTPPVSPPQGNNGGTGSGPQAPASIGGGGGGASTVGSSNTTSANPGGDGATSSIDGTPTARAGGGGAGASNYPAGPGSGGAGGGGAGGNPSTSPGNAGTTNTGGGGGAGGQNSGNATGGAGGSGIVVIRYKFQ